MRDCLFWSVASRSLQSSFYHHILHVEKKANAFPAANGGPYLYFGRLVGNAETCPSTTKDARQPKRSGLTTDGDSSILRITWPSLPTSKSGTRILQDVLPYLPIVPSLTSHPPLELSFRNPPTKLHPTRTCSPRPLLPPQQLPDVLQKSSLASEALHLLHPLLDQLHRLAPPIVPIWLHLPHMRRNTR